MRSVVVLSILALVAALSFQNCGPSFVNTEESATIETKLEACDEALLLEFAATYHKTLRRIGCNNCHAPGGQRFDAAFAQDDQILAFLEFKKRGSATINARIQDGHNSSLPSGQVLYSNTDPGLLKEIDDHLKKYQGVERTCSGGAKSITAPPKQATIFDPAKVNDINHCGIGDPLTTAGANGQTLTWDLGAIRPDLAGVQVSIEISPDAPASFPPNICAHTGYRAGDVKITTAKALQLKNLRIFMNGNHFGVNTFMLTRTVPAGSMNYKMVDSLSGGYGVYDSGSCKQADQWSFAIESIEVQP